jgi:hypothetical protein
VLRRLVTFCVLLVLLLGANPVPAPPAQAQEGDRYFPETGFTVPARFMTYWNTHGGLPIFGYPITAAQMEDGYLTQYFERNRFEYHPETPARPTKSCSACSATN